ncbi:DUF445 domain-containing protein [Rhodoferax lithotrophicus]|nr:DUF445 domain-containing protein [Rhodoferax sp. MIZ03]
MQRISFGLLLVMAVMYAIAVSYRHIHPAIGYLAAFSEAAMVGAVADWFAVVALFRHPLSIPIWHTAIIPNSKEDIGRNLGEFVETHFITEEAITRRIRSANPADLLSTWLLAPKTATNLGHAAAHALNKVLDSLDDAKIKRQLGEVVGRQLSQLNMPEMAANVVDLFVAEKKHEEMLDGILEWAVGYLADTANQPKISEFLIHAIGAENIIFKTAITKVSPSLIKALWQSAKDIRTNPHHALRNKYGVMIQEFVQQLKADPDWQNTITQYQQDTLNSEQVKNLLNGIWDLLKDRLNMALDRHDPVMGGQLTPLIRQIGHTLATDAQLSAWLNEAIESGSASMIHQYRGEVGCFIEDQLKQWTKDEMSNRIELAIGSDLQFIRINGTVVGGLVGLVIYAITQLTGKV